MDPRVKKLAHLLINYSLKLKKGQLLKIQGESVTAPLMQAVFEEALKVGANPYVQVIMPDIAEAFLKHGTDEQLKYIPPIFQQEINQIDAFVAIWGSQNLRYLSGVDPNRQAINHRARQPLIKKMFKPLFMLLMKQ